MQDSTTTRTQEAPLAPAGRLSAPLMRSVAFRFGIYGMNALTGIMTARALNPTGRGQLAAILIWPMLLAGMSTGGIPSALIYHLRQKPERASAVLGCALVLSVVTGLTATLAGWHLVPLWLDDQHSDVVRAAQFALLATVVSALTLTTRAAWEARGRVDLSNVMQLVSPVVTALVLLPFILYGGLTPGRAAAIYVLAGVPTLAYGLTALTRIWRPSLRATKGLWTSLLHFGARGYGVDLCGTLAIYLDQALVVGLLAADAMGTYVVALSVARVLNAVQGSVAAMMFPRLVGIESNRLGATAARAARLSALVSAGLGVVVILFGGTLLRHVYGAGFEDGGHLLPILVAEVILSGMTQVLMQGLLAAGRPGLATMIQMSGLALSVPVFLTLVPWLGARGAALALLASTSMRLLMVISAYPTFLKVARPRVWVGRLDFTELAAYRLTLMRSLAGLREGALK